MTAPLVHLDDVAGPRRGIVQRHPEVPIDETSSRSRSADGLPDGDMCDVVRRAIAP